MTMRKGPFVALLLVLLVLLAGCPRPQATLRLGGGPSSAAATVRGHVDLAALSGGMAVQAVMSDVASFATVSLIDTTTNQTVATAVTDGQGNFNLGFGGFTPNPAHTYFMEAVKGLFGNQAGKNAARVRTVLGFANGGWVSLTNTIPNAGIQIDRSTTALSVIVGLRALTGNPVTGASLLGGLTPNAPDASIAPTTDGTFTKASNAMSGVSNAEFHQVWAAVADVLVHNFDPVAGVLINTTPNGAAPWYTYYEALNGFQVTTLSPSSGPIGTTVTLIGSSFDPTLANNVVKFNGVPVQPAGYVSVSSDQSRLVVKVPPGATTGPVSVQIGVMASTGPTFSMTSNDGHNVFDAAGNLLVAGKNGAIYKVSPTGSVSKFDSGYQNPCGLTQDAAGNVYVADFNANAIYKINASGTASSSFCSAGLNGPYELAFDTSGLLYCTNYWAGTLSQITTGGVASTYVSGLSGPEQLAFDPNSGALFVACSTSQSVVKVVGGVASTYATGFTTPAGLAVDTGGNVFVTNYNGTSVQRIAPSGAITTFASRYTQPRSLAFDPFGNLHLGCDVNAVYRFTPGGAETLLSSAFCTPQGLTYDTAGNLVATGVGNNTVARAPAGVGSVAQPAGNVPGPASVATDSAGNLYVSSNASALYKAPPGGSPAIWAYTQDIPWGLTVDPSNNVYYGGQQTGQIYKVDAAGNPQGTYAWNPCWNTAQVATGSNGAGGVYVYYANQNLNSTSNGSVVRCDPATGRLVTLVTGYRGITGVAVDAANNVYFNSNYFGSIYRYSGGTVTTLATIAGSNLTGLGIDPAGNLFACDANSKVWKVTSPGGAGPWPATLSTAWAVGMNQPSCITFDQWGSYYVSDQGNGNVYKLTSAGSVAPPPTYCTGLGGPREISFDSAYNLYAADFNQGNIRKVATGSLAPSLVVGNLCGLWGVCIDPTTSTMYVTEHYCQGDLLQFTTAGSRLADLARSWNIPESLLWDPSGNLWVTGYNYVFEVLAGGAGTLLYPGYCATAQGLARDPAGYMYAVDQGRGLVIRYTPGSPQTATWVTNQNALNQPCGLTMDPSGTSLLVTELSNHDALRIPVTGGFPATPVRTGYWPYRPMF